MLRALLSLLVLAGATGSGLAQAPLLEIKQNNPVLGLAWSADGKRLATAWQDGLIRIADIPSGKEAIRLKTGVPVSGLAFTADGKFLGIKSGLKDGPLCVWDLGTQKKIRELAYMGYTCNQLAFTPDGQTFVASGPGEHMVWCPFKGNGYGSRMHAPPPGSSAAVSANGAVTAWSDPKGFVQLHLVQSRQHQHMQVGPARALTLSPDGRLLAVAATDKTIHLWEIQGGVVRKFEGLRLPAHLLHISGNGKVLAAASPGDPVVRLWDANSGRLRRRLTTNPAEVRFLALSPDGMILAIAGGKQLTLWNVATRQLGDLGPARALSAAELKSAWQDLASKDQAQAEAAFRRLAAAQNHALEFLKNQVRAVAVPAVDSQRVNKLLKDLDHPQYRRRQRAWQELAGLGELIRPALDKYLAGRPSLEGSRRAQKLLDRLHDPELTPDRLRCLETIEILEILQTPQARTVLDEIARDALLTQVRLAAREALNRLNRH